MRSRVKNNLTCGLCRCHFPQIMYILYAWTARKSTLNLSTAALGCPFWETCYRAEIDAKASRRHGPKKLSLAHWRPGGAPFCPGRVLDKTWTEPGQDLFMSWTRPGHALDKTWTEAVRQDFDVAFLPQCTDLGRKTGTFLDFRGWHGS